MIAHRPCGKCGALVPAATGCVHWSPGRRLSKIVGSRERARRKAAASPKVAELIQETGRSYDDR